MFGLRWRCGSLISLFELSLIRAVRQWLIKGRNWNEFLASGKLPPYFVSSSLTHEDPVTKYGNEKQSLEQVDVATITHNRMLRIFGFIRSIALLAGASDGLSHTTFGLKSDGVVSNHAYILMWVVVTKATNLKYSSSMTTRCHLKSCWIATWTDKDFEKECRRRNRMRILDISSRTL